MTGLTPGTTYYARVASFRSRCSRSQTLLIVLLCAATSWDIISRLNGCFLAHVYSYFRSSSTLQPTSGVKVRGVPTAPTLSGQTAQTFKGVSSLVVTIAQPSDTGEGTADVALTEYAVEVSASLTNYNLTSASDV